MKLNLKLNLKLKHLVLVLFFFHIYIFAQRLTLSPNAEVSVITVGPGTSLNDAFGHNAFRIKDQSVALYSNVFSLKIDFSIFR